MTDPYAVRARTHRSNGWPHSVCTRCYQPYPCDRAGQVDPESRSGCAPLFAILGALGAVGVLCVIGGGWLLGWWS